jgi:hypothetical protein
VAEGARLLIACRVTPTEGSNPSLSELYMNKSLFVLKGNSSKKYRVFKDPVFLEIRLSQRMERWPSGRRRTLGKRV